MGTSKRERQKANKLKAREARAKQQLRAKTRKRGLLFGLGIPALVVALFLISRGVSGGDSSNTTIPTNSSDLATVTSAPESSTTSVAAGTPIINKVTYGTGACPATDGTQARKSDLTEAPKKCIDESKTYTATLATTEGDIVIALDAKNAPYTVNNYVSISRYKYYDGTTVFRTDPSIDIIQLGGNSPSDQFGYTIQDEGSGYTYETGDVVMARTGSPNSGGAQYFIVTGKNGSLLNSQGTYVKFGHVSKGLDVAQKIIGLHQATNDGLGGKPSRTVTVKTVTITEK